MVSPAGRVAVLSDIHGVMPALAAVLAEPDLVAANLIVLTGDLAAGPQPVETLDRLVALGDRAVWIRGNADRELVEFARGERTEMPDEVYEFMRLFPQPVRARPAVEYVPMRYGSRQGGSLSPRQP